MITRYIVILMVGWTAVCGLGLWSAVSYTHRMMAEMAVGQARLNFLKDYTFRMWVTSHGGVYVPQTEKTQPNPYLVHISERDIETPSGRRLTLMNPAYVMRQYYEFSDEKIQMNKGHLTSLKPIRPENAPDDMERRALERFEMGEKEVISFIYDDPRPYLFYMQPMVVEEGCLKCHAHQGYKIGDIRGGVSVRLDMEGLLAMKRRSNVMFFEIIGAIWALGMVGLFWGGRFVKKAWDRREEALDEAQRVLGLLQQEREMFVSGPVVVFKWQNLPNWPVEYVSSNVWDVLGYSDQDFLTGKVKYAAIIHKDDLERVGAEVVDYSSDPQRLHFTHSPYRLFTKSGNILWVLDHTMIIRDTSGTITHYLGYIFDITKEKEAEHLLAINEERLHLALDAAELGLWDWNVQTGEVVFNERWASMLGYTLDEIAPHVSTWEELVHPDDKEQVMRILNAHLEGKTPLYRTEHRLRAKSGEWKWVLDMGKVVERFPDGSPLRALGIHQDITERKKVEEALMRQERLSAIGQLSAGIAHDFNNIMTGIIGHAELLLVSKDVKEDVRQAVHKILNAAKRASKLVRQLLDFSKQSISHKNTVELKPFMEEMWEFLRRSIPETIQLRLEMTQDDCWVNADLTQLHQVITNLVINAKDAISHGGEIVLRLYKGISNGEIKCSVCGTPIQGDWCCISVEDTGSGIAPEVMEHMFEPFFTTKGVGKGTGLGLAQVVGILEQHNAHVYVVSQLGKGTRFNIYLPPSVAHNQAVQMRAEKTDVKENAKADPNALVLLVDDEPVVLDVMQPVLEYLGYKVLRANGPQEALSMFVKEWSAISVVLSDMSMPEMDGIELFKALKEIDPHVRFVIMTGYPLHQEDAMLKEQGISAWIQKPVSMKALSQLLKDVMSKNGKGDGVKE